MLTGEQLIMSEKECQRQVLLSEVASGRRSLVSASSAMGLSDRQGRRLWSRDQLLGVKGILHKSRGVRSNRRYYEELKAKVCSLYAECYSGFGPTLFSEYLLENERGQLYKDLNYDQIVRGWDGRIVEIFLDEGLD